MLRERAGKSQERLAEQAGISREAIAALEQGRQSNPQLATLLSIVSACGCSMSDLFPGESQIRFEDSSVGVEEHAEIYRKLRFVLGHSRRKERVLMTVINELYREVKSGRRK